MRRNLVLLALSIVFITDALAQIKSGPMLGYNTLREVGIWVETKKPQSVDFQYWPQSDPSNKTIITQTTHQRKGNTTTFQTYLLEPGTTYNYQIIPEGSKAEDQKTYTFTTQSLWHWRTSPPDFSFLAGSCVFINEEAYDRPGKGYGGEYEIFTHMADEDAEFMVWLGDNTYLREVDYDSRSGIYHRFSHSRNVAEMQDLLANMHHYAIWDDHDYGPNDSDWTYPLKSLTKEAFFDYWPMPARGIGGSEGITNSFVYNDCQFFLMDNRWYREHAGRDNKIIGDQQMAWLIDALRYSKANYKFICIGGQFLSDAALFENHANFSNERQELIDAIDQYGISNVIFLTGDRHHSEVSTLKTKNGTRIYDITSSPITSTAYDHSHEPNRNRMGETIGERNYAKIQITGPFKERKIQVVFKNKKGEVVQTLALD
jgi:alkaline phosphatase D